MNRNVVLIKKLDERAVIPQYAHDGDVCMDLTTIAVDYDEEHDMYIYHTGLAFQSERNIGQFLFLRSSNCRTDCYLCNGVGIADSAIYRGEIQFRVKNRDSIEVEILSRCIKTYKPYPEMKTEVMNEARELRFAPYKVGERIGQMVFMNYPTTELVVVDELGKSDRGEGGFGSTGK